MSEELCTQCGAPIQNGTSFCTECGTSFAAHVPGSAQTAATAYFPEPQPAHASPVYDVPPPKSSRFAVLSFGGAFGSLLVMSIPVIGWIFCIIWALGGAKNHNRRSLARAVLFSTLLVAALLVLCYQLVSAIIGQSLWSWLTDNEIWKLIGLL